MKSIICLRSHPIFTSIQTLMKHSLKYKDISYLLRISGKQCWRFCPGDFRLFASFSSFKFRSPTGQKNWVPGTRLSRETIGRAGQRNDSEKHWDSKPKSANFKSAILADSVGPKIQNFMTEWIAITFIFAVAFTLSSTIPSRVCKRSYDLITHHLDILYLIFVYIPPHSVYLGLVIFSLKSCVVNFQTF